MATEENETKALGALTKNILAGAQGLAQKIHEETGGKLDVNQHLALTSMAATAAQAHASAKMAAALEELVELARIDIKEKVE